MQEIKLQVLIRSKGEFLKHGYTFKGNDFADFIIQYLINLCQNRFGEPISHEKVISPRKLLF